MAEDEDETVRVCVLLEAMCNHDHSHSSQDIQNQIQQLLKLIRNHEHRDIDYASSRFTVTMQSFCLYIISSRLNVLDANAPSVLCQKLNILKAFFDAEEFDNKIFENIFSTEQLIRGCFTKLVNIPETSEDDEENEAFGCICRLRAFVFYLCHRIYLNIPRYRPIAKSFLGAVIRRATIVHNDSVKLRSYVHAAVPCLQLCVVIIRGFRLPLSPENRDLALKLLFDLHDIPGKISHVQPLLAVVHGPMLSCIEEFLRHEQLSGDTGILSKLVQKITMAWPSNFMGNSPKAILLLKELKRVLQHLGKSNDSNAEDDHKKQCLDLSPISRSLLFSRFAQSMTSENSDIVRTVLRMWRDDILVKYFKMHVNQMSSLCVKPLVSKAMKHWNETVRRHACVVLMWFIEHDPNGAARACKTQYASEVQSETSKNESSCVDKNDSINDIIMWLENLVPETVRSEKEGKNETAEMHLGINNAGPGHEKEEHGSSENEKVGMGPGNTQEVDGSISLFDLVFGKDLGKGSFANVRYAKRIVRGTAASNWTQEYAVKNISKKHEKVAKREAHAMRQFSSPYLVKLVASFTSSKKFHLVMEYCKDGDLHSILAQNGPLDTASAQFISGEVLNGLHHIHSLGYVYGDLKVENILIHASGHAKIGDFGSTRLATECLPDEIEGTAIYLAPELLQHQKASFKSDFWSFGCLVFQTLAGRPPGWALLQEGSYASKVEDTTNSSAMDEGVSKRIVTFSNTTSDDGYDKYPSHFHKFSMSLLDRLLEHDPLRRYEFDECARSPFFQNYIVQNESENGKPFDIGGEIHLANLHKETPPKLKTNSKAELPEGGLWKRRMFSLVVSTTSTLENQSAVVDISSLQKVEESDLECESTWVPSGPSFNLFGEDGLRKVDEGKTSGSASENYCIAPQKGYNAVDTKRPFSSSMGSETMRDGGRQPIRAMHTLPSMGSNVAMSRPPRRFPRRRGRGGVGDAARDNKKKAGLLFKGIDLTAG